MLVGSTPDCSHDLSKGQIGTIQAGRRDDRLDDASGARIVAIAQAG